MTPKTLAIRYLPTNTAWALCFGDQSKPEDLTIVRLHVSPHTLYMDRDQLVVDLALCGLSIGADGRTVE